MSDVIHLCSVRDVQITSEMKCKQNQLVNKDNADLHIQVLSSDDEDVGKSSPALKATSDSPEDKNKTGQEDKSVQTDFKWVQQVIEKIVSSRMKVYSEAVKNEDHLDRRLSPLLQKLKQENMELRNKAMYLKSKLEKCEKHTVKRSADQPIANPPLVKKCIPDTSSSATVIPTAAVPPLVSKQSPKNPPGLMPRSNLIETVRQPLHQAMHPQQYHFVPASPASMSYPQRLIVPATINAQQTPIYCYPPTERFMLIENPVVNQGYNISTQVVGSNQGLRMASHPNDVQKTPIYNSSVRPASNVSTLRSFQPVPTNSVRTDFPQAEARTAHSQQCNGNVANLGDRTRTYSKSEIITHNTNTQMPGNPIRPTIPNIALPFSSLPKLKASISATGSGIILTWDYEKPGDNPDKYKVECYQLFAHQAKNHTPRTQVSDVKDWKKIGVVNALPLPMACTLTQFATGNVYYFAVVAVDIHGREGEMSNKCVIRLNLNPPN